MMKQTFYAAMAFALAAVGANYGNAAENIAVGAKATASSIEQADCSAANAVDGRGNTRWSSKRTDNEWLLVDLGAPKTVAQIQLDWEAAAGRSTSFSFPTTGRISKMSIP